MARREPERTSSVLGWTAGLHRPGIAEEAPGPHPLVLWLAAGVLAIAAVVAAGWLSGARALASFIAQSVPMAPATTLGFGLFGGSVIASALWGHMAPVRRASSLVAAAVALSGLLVLVESFLGLDGGVDRLFLADVEVFAGAPVGRVSPATGALFVLAALSFLFSSPGARAEHWRQDAAAGLAACVAAGGAVVCLGYATGISVLYRGAFHPVALPTGIAFVLLGLALLAGSLHRLAGPGRGIVVAAAVGLGVVISVASFLTANTLQSEHARSEIEHGGEAIHAAVRAALQDALAEVGDIVTIVEGGKTWTAPELQGLFAVPAALRSGLALVAWAPRVPDQERLAFEQAWQKESARAALIREWRSGGAIRAGRRAEYYPLRLLAPRAGFEDVLGLDLASHAELWVALEEAAARHAPRASALFQSRPSGGVRLVWLLRPAYPPSGPEVGGAPQAPRPVGFAVGGLDPGELVAGALRTVGKTPLEITLFDVTAGGKELLYAGRAAPSGGLEGGHWAQELEVAGRTWLLEAAPQAGKLAEEGVPSTKGFLAGGLVLTALLGTALFAAARRGAESQQMAAALRESEERFRSLVRSSADGIVVADEGGRIVSFNDAAARMFGHQRGEAIGKSVTLLIPERLRKAHEDGLARVAAGGTPRVVGKTVEMSAVRSDASEFPVEVSLSTWSSGGQRFFSAFMRDVTSRKLIEEQLEHAQRMEAVGKLAGGVAHEFNNALQAMQASVQLLRGSPGEPAQATRALEQLEDQIRRAAATARQLVLFSHREVARRELVDLNELVAAAVRLVRRVLRNDIGLDVDLATRPLGVEGDRGQLEQVLMNLVVNAGEAMLHGGLLTVRTGAQGEREAWLEVEDTGIGMSEEVRSRLFEPFFTTKGPERGTGLGLAVTHGIVTSHGGRIEVASVPGEGSTFRVALPCVPVTPAATPAPATVAPAAPAPVTRGSGERVLVVEDEADAREGLLAVLELLGYRGVAVGSGEAALALPAGAPFDALLSDLRLPGIQGGEVARLLAGRWPSLCIILMSGYTEDEATRAAVAAGALRFLQKPFDMDSLARTLRAALDEEPGSGVRGPGTEKPGTSG
ncbi:MAG: PAS domain S-box protein [Acidobacteriota bacterium]